MQTLKKLFIELDVDGSGALSPDEIKQLAVKFYDGRPEVPQDLIAGMLDCLGKDAKGEVTWEIFEQAAHHLLEDLVTSDGH